MLKTAIIVAVVLLAGLAIACALGANRWNAGTRDLRGRLLAARRPIRPEVIDFGQLKGLPAPVQRYFRAVLTEGRPMVTGARVEHRGTFNSGETEEQWKRFTSDQLVITQRPGFDWDARIAMMPGLTARVHDAYVAGEGILHAALFGLIAVANMRGTGEVAEGELMRFFAEAAWYPTALLPNQGVQWQEIDQHSARATLADGSVTVKLIFRFNPQGLIEAVTAEARGRTVGDQVIPTPWEGRFWNYQTRAGMLVPLDGEVAWFLPAGAKPYWRGSIVRIEYDFAR